MTRTHKPSLLPEVSRPRRRPCLLRAVTGVVGAPHRFGRDRSQDLGTWSPSRARSRGLRRTRPAVMRCFGSAGHRPPSAAGMRVYGSRGSPVWERAPQRREADGWPARPVEQPVTQVGFEFGAPVGSGHRRRRSPARSPRPLRCAAVSKFRGVCPIRPRFGTDLGRRAWPHIAHLERSERRWMNGGGLRSPRATCPAIGHSRNRTSGSGGEMARTDPRRIPASTCFFEITAR